MEQSDETADKAEFSLRNTAGLILFAFSHDMMP